MQNFSNSPAPPSLPPGFSGRGGAGPSYPPQPTDPQISPRMTEDYTGLQQQSLHRGHHHPSQASHMLAYGARSRGAGEPPPAQGSIHSGNSSNPYRKEAMEYYFSMGGKDRHRRGGGMGYGAGFGYPSIDGHTIPHQYRHAGSGSASSSGMMSPYPVDYVSTAGGGSSSGGGAAAAAGAFSPSHQYNISQNPAMQSVAGSQMQHRQHGQNYQGLHHGQQHRTYPHSGHRMTPQYTHYSPQSGASTGSSGMYSPPPQRYHDGTSGAGFDRKVNSSPNINSTSNSVSSSVAANNVGPVENVPQSYHASSYPAYSPQTHSLHKQATLQHRNSQHNLGVGYDNSLKMQHHGPSPSSVYAKLHQASNPSIPHPASQEIAKSPMHSNAQQTQINQNFSPISNPSPAASAVQSPSCSSSPSPLMGVSEAHGNPSAHAPSHAPPQNPRSSHSHGRLLQTMPQLSPTPNSNSSISSCGSSGSHKAQGMNASAGGGHSSASRNRMSIGPGMVSRDDGSTVYPSSPLDKLQDAGLNSLNALTSQVANLPNTVQHMLLTDTMLSQRKGKDGGQMQQASLGMSQSQPRSRNASAASSTSTVREGSGAGGGDGASSEAGAEEDSTEKGPSTAKVERDEQCSEGEHGRMRQMSGASSGSEAAGYYPLSQTQNQPQAVKGSHVKTISSESTTKPPSVSEIKASETHIPSSSSSPSFGSQPSEPDPNSHSRPSVSFTPTSSSSNTPLPQSNSVPEPGAINVDSRYSSRKTIEIKNEGIKGEHEGMVERREKGSSQAQGDGEVKIRQDVQDKENRLDGVSSLHSNERDGKQQASEEQQNASSVGVIVSTRSEGSHPEKNKLTQDNSIEEKHSHAYFRDSSSHNGEEGVDLSVYSSHHQLHQKSNFGRPQNPPLSGPHKFSYQESPYGSDLSMKNRGRAGTGAVVESNSRYAGYHQSQSSYGPVVSKDIGSSVVEAPGKRVEGPGARGHEDNTQMQQYPSLLQEVLQGYILDRRYGRPEQALPTHLQAQQQFQTRQPYGMAESMRVQTGMSETTPHSSQIASSVKPQQANQRQGSGSDFGPEPHSTMKSESTSIKASQNVERSKMAVSHSHYLPQSAEPPPPKHINLADYSLPQRKAPSNLPTPSSAVQELLLQETEPLTGSVGQTESQKSSASLLAPSSERRSVICDVSPNRRSTPERERETDREREREKSQSGASVIQQPFSSPTAANDLTKKDLGEKQVVKMEAISKEAVPEALNLQADHHGSVTAKEPDAEFHTKSAHPTVVMNADPYRRGNVDIPPIPPHPTSSNPLSPPSRHQAYLHGVDLSAGHSGGFPGYRYVDTREGNVVPRSNPHFPSHHPYHSLSPQAQIQNPQSTNKLQMYPHPRGPPHQPHDMNDRLDWVAAMNRPKEMMMQPGSSPGRHKLSQPDQRQRILSQTDIMPNEQHIAKTPLTHQGAYYEMKMWESPHPGREGGATMEGEPYYRTQPPPPPPIPVAPHAAIPPPIGLAAGPSVLESEISRAAAEEVKQPRPPPASNLTKPPADANQPLPQGQRQSKGGGSGDTNPLMLRRRVRSFISPIPAKRQHQDGSQQRGAPNSHHSPGVHSESSRHNEDDSSPSDISCPQLSSPMPGQNAYTQALSPSSSKTKVLPPRKGRGLKLEAIVQKITPNVKKPTGHSDVDSNNYPSFSHSDMSQFSDSQDQDLAHFPRVAAGDDGYMDDPLNDMIPFRGVDESGPLPSSTFPCDPHQTSQGLKQSDFDFGIGAAVAAASGDKEDFALLGPLPPPPPLPRPVQGSPPPSSSALSDIQHFTNTYQQLETRRGEQSAANLLRQKLQETGMGFDDYPGSDYYGTTPPHHSQTPGHMMNRQHQMSSVRSSRSPQDSKLSDSLVPKGYFPSGKKKGRPVGSVNKQKRAQNQAQAQGQVQAQNTAPGTPPAQPATSPAAAITPQITQSTSGTATPTAPPLSDQKDIASLAPPVLTQVVKVDAESEDTQPEVEVKPLRRRRRGVKDEGEPVEGKGRQRRRRRGAAVTTAAMAAKDDLDTPLGTGGSLSGGFPDLNRKGAFVPHIHVEKKIPEIGAVCTIVNAEEEKMKGERSALGGKAGGSGMESLLTSALTSQLCRRDREMEKRDSDEVEATLQSGKALPSSGYVVSGPVITETNHSGRLLCCLCQKWANYKHLGDLYGPFYPAEYAAKLPKNPPQVRQCQATTGANKTGPNVDTNSNVLSAIPETQTQDIQVAKSSTDSDYAVSVVTNPKSPNTTVETASPNGGEDMMMYLAGKLDNISSTTTTSTTTSTSTTSTTPSLTWDMNLDNRPIPELKREPEIQDDQQQEQKPPKQQQTDEAKQRPQHRKLTSHPRFKRRHKSSEDSPRMVPSNSKASLPFQPPPPALDSLGPLAQLAQLPQMPMDPEELWVHEGCIVWTSGVYLVNGRLYGLQEALDGARDTCCSYCEMVGSTLGCYSKGCTLQYHYLCAIEADCSLNEDNFSLRCPKHKFPQSSRPSKSVYLEQSERG